jgi:hypothetical protein
VYVVSLNDEADDFNGIEFLGAGKRGADQHVHESYRDKWQSLFSTKGNEVYFSRNEKSWVTHAVLIGESIKKLLKKSSLAPLTGGV